MSFVVVLQTGDQVAIGFAKEILEAEGIEYQVRGEGLQHLVGIGTLGTGFNIVTGPAELSVNEDDVDAARDLLEDFISAA